MNELEKMRELVDKLNEYAYRYYVLDEPVVSDKEYDALYDVHVVPRIPFSQFQLYTLEDLSGLETVQ